MLSLSDSDEDADMVDAKPEEQDDDMKVDPPAVSVNHRKSALAPPKEGEADAEGFLFMDGLWYISMDQTGELIELGTEDPRSGAPPVGGDKNVNSRDKNPSPFVKPDLAQQLADEGRTSG